MIGRERELATMLGALDEAIETGRPRLVVLYGSAGIGKSRLAAEFVRAARRADPDLRMLRGRSPRRRPRDHLLGAGRDPARRLRDRARRAGRGGRGAPARRRASAVLGGARPPDDGEGTDGRRAGRLHRAADSPATAGRWRHRRPAEDLARAWPRFASAYVADAPAIWLVEDLHWAGEAAVEMLERDRARGPPVRWCSWPPRAPSSPSRSPASPPGAGRRARSRSRPLTETQSAGAGRAAAHGGRASRRRSADEILAKAEGNPFFVEEIIRRLIDEGVAGPRGRPLASHGAGAAASPSPTASTALLAAAVDALPAEERRVLQEAAVIGRTFWADAVVQAHRAGSGRSRCSGWSGEAWSLVRPTTSLTGQEEFAFKHALVRDVAYASQPKAQARPGACGGAAPGSSDWPSDRTDEFAELIAHHY